MKLHFFIGLFMLTCVFLPGEIVAQDKSPEQVILERTFKSSYDRRVRPFNRGENASVPTTVTVNVYLRSVDKVDDINGEFNVQLTFRQKWRDERLMFSPTGGMSVVTLINPNNQIWTPDTFFSNEKVGQYHDLMIRNEFVRISSRGEVLHSGRVSLRLSCPMIFKKFPLDTQTCSIRFASYGRTMNELRYVWDRDNPVQIPPSLMVNLFNLDGHDTTTCDSITTTGTYSCLRVDFTLKRIFRPYLIHVYIPSTMMTIISWFSFWVSGVHSATARMVLTVSALLVLATQTSEVNKSFPVSTRTRSVDNWTGICLTFVFAALLEFIIVQYIAGHNNTKNCEKASSEPEPEPENGIQDVECANIEEHEIPLKETVPSGENEKDNSNDDGNKENSQPKLPTAAELIARAREITEKYLSTFPSQHEKIDGACRVAFPAAFLLFNIFYWPIAAF